jgi:hypothetical protein
VIVSLFCEVDVSGIDPNIVKRLQGTSNIMESLYNAGAGFKNTTDRGNEREIFVSEFLRKCIPAAVDIGTGEIIDNFGTQSGQIDVVIESALRPSFGIPASEAKLYMAHSVAMVIEVKSILTSEEWSGIEDHARKVRMLKRDTLPKKMGKDNPAAFLVKKFYKDKARRILPKTFPGNIPYFVVAMKADW